MIGVIFGEKGTGKTKHILEHANKTAKEAKGSIVFIDDDNSYMYDLSTSIRFVNTSEYGIHTPKMLYGFLCGIAAMDFDLEYIYIDGFLNIARHDMDTLEGLFQQLQKLVDDHHLNLILSINGDGKSSPAFMQKYIMRII